MLDTVTDAPLTLDVSLSVDLSALLGRNRHAMDVAAVAPELRELAVRRLPGRPARGGGGTGAGFNETDQNARAFVTALKAVPGAAEWVEVGRERAGAWHAAD